MKLLYATSITFPSVRANRIQILNMAKAFQKVLKTDFLFGISTAGSAELGVSRIEMGAGRSFVLAWRFLKLAKKQGITDVYCREEKLLFFILFYNTFLRAPLRFWYEVHHLPYLHTWWHQFILQRINGVVSITAAMKKEISHVYQGDVLVAPDAVTIEIFDIPLSVEEARSKTGLSLSKKIIMYAGSIDEPWKGVEVFYDAAEFFDDSYYFVIVGGKPHYVEYFKAHHPPRDNVVFVGHKEYETELPYYLKSSDVLVVPNSAKAEISRLSTSPLKIFAYMAAGKSIVASDLPSLKEVLNDSNAHLVEPDSPKKLAEGIQTVLADKNAAEARAEQARKDVERYTWQKRAENIINFIC